MPETPTLPAATEGFFVRPSEGETLVYDRRRNTAHGLDEIAALVFRACLERADVDALLRRLGELRPDADPRELLAHVLERLVDARLLEEPARSDGTWSRRTLLSSGTRAAFALPVVTSVLAPTPAAAGSFAPGISPSPWSCGGNTEEYDHYEENPFREVAVDPVFTLSADVDTASYANVRRFLRDGRLPPRESVRLEELLNYVRYDDPLPSGSRPLEVTAELAPCPWQRDHELLRLGLATAPIVGERLPPRNLVFLLDVSGSMAAPDKLPLVRSSMHRLIETLDGRDRVAIVVYAGASGLVLEPTPGDRRDVVLAALDRLEAGGSTHGSAGLELAYRVAESGRTPGGINRVVLATDGDFNVGVTSRGGLVRLVESYRDRGVELSVLGFGTGNLKDSTMEQLAAHGNGNYAYIDGIAEARRVLVAEAGATLFTVARDVKLQLELNPAEVVASRLLGYENRLMAREAFADDSKDAVELGAGHHVTVLFELAGEDVLGPRVRPLRYREAPRHSAASTRGELGLLAVRWRPPEGGPSELLEWPLVRSEIRAPVGRPSDAFRLAAGVATFGLLLRGSDYRGSASFALARELVESVASRTDERVRAELVTLIERARRLAGD